MLLRRANLTKQRIPNNLQPPEVPIRAQASRLVDLRDVVVGIYVPVCSNFQPDCLAVNLTDCAVIPQARNKHSFIFVADAHSTDMCCVWLFAPSLSIYFYFYIYIHISVCQPNLEMFHVR